MQFSSPFELCPANEVERGCIVVLQLHHGSPMAALAVQRSAGKAPTFLMLEPTDHPWGGSACILDVNTFGSTPILKIPGAKAVVPGSLDAGVSKPYYDDVPPGALTFGDDGRLLIVGLVAKGTSMMWAIDNGEEFRPIQRQLWFPVWDIAVPDANDMMQTLCTVRAQTKA